MPHHLLYMQILFLFAAFQVLVAQFINEPSAYDSADIYSAPTGTSVVSFTSSDATSQASQTTSISDVATAAASYTTPQTSGSFKSTSSSPAANSDTIVSLSSSSGSPSIPSGDAVVTDMHTYYTTVPCTTTNAITSRKTSIVQQGQEGLQTDSIGTHTKVTSPSSDLPTSTSNDLAWTKTHRWTPFPTPMCQPQTVTDTTVEHVTRTIEHTSTISRTITVTESK